MRRKLQKLRRTSLDELRVRGAQAFAAFAERRSWSSQSRLISDAELGRLLHSSSITADLRQHFQQRTDVPFLSSFENPVETLQEFRRRWPAAEQRISEQADRITSGRFDLLGLKNLTFGDPIDWHLEPVAGKRAPLVHWSRLNYLDSSMAGDKKIIWELNRHQHFVTLGQAYWLTGDSRYAHAFDSQVNSWIEQNPPKLGINWASSLEVAFRSVAWIWALYFFRHSPAVQSSTHIRLWKFLYLNARHLETYLSTYFSPNTHLTGEALGLFYIGCVLPEFKDAARWRKRGLNILLTQLGRHVKSDGVYFEQSTYYHRYTADFYLHLAILLRARGETVSPKLQSKLNLLLDHLMYITRPDGTTPLIGDDDGGRLVRLDSPESNDFRGTLSTGASFFRRPDLKFVARGAAEETLWLLGPQGLNALDEIQMQEPARQSVGFEDGGYYVMRDGWTEDANYLLFDCGPHGVDNCGHAHADALSFDLAANGRTLLVDPGTFTYTGSSEVRDWFRSSAAHNTLTVDRLNSSVPKGPFSWNTIATCEVETWVTQKRFDYVSGCHDGFQRLPTPLSHSRSILFLKKDYWLVRDQVSAAGEHVVQNWFHFDTGVAPLKSKGSVQVISENGHPTRLQLCAFPSIGNWSTEDGWVSHCYGVKQEAPTFSFSLLVNGSVELVTFILPEMTGAPSKPVVREIEAAGGRAFEINHSGRHDVLLLRDRREERNQDWPESEIDAPAVEIARMASDFDLTWVRFSNEHARMPDELVLLDGRSFELEGQEILASSNRLAYLVARRIDDQYCVETENGELVVKGLSIGDVSQSST